MCVSEEELFAGFELEDAVRLTGYDDCIVGVVEQIGQIPVLCYDLERMVRKLAEKDGMTQEEALEFLDYNYFNAFLGEGTPCFITFNDKTLRELQCGTQ